MTVGDQGMPAGRQSLSQDKTVCVGRLARQTQHKWCTEAIRTVRRRVFRARWSSHEI